MLILALLLLAAAVVLFVLARKTVVAFTGATSLAALIGLAGIAVGTGSVITVVGAHEVGVPVTFGKIGSPLASGIHLTSPFTTVSTFSTRPVDLTLSKDDQVEVRSSQGGVMDAELTVKWSVSAKDAVELYRLAGSEEAVQQRLVYPDSREIVRNVFARHTSEEGYVSQREQIGREIEELLTARLAPRGIVVDAVNLRNVQPSEELQKQIDLKIQQEQSTERAEEATRTAKAEAERKRVEAEGDAAANAIVNRSLTDKVLLSQCIEAFKEAAAKNPVYATPCGSGGASDVIVDGTRD
ncbi:prohibitin family protein [Streptomyces sp. NBC_00873]|uniref:prohibitin family protein n=1 Tax=unclassified Streptomyces TaxID=2593676 RepID=UPI00386ED16B|nr:prohibitin family protein [Streptomyces sp. NBC_00873]WTA44346.1 prohibitin family protein [Streptomyces sp. NBC_00842]